MQSFVVSCVYLASAGVIFFMLCLDAKQGSVAKESSVVAERRARLHLHVREIYRQNGGARVFSNAGGDGFGGIFANGGANESGDDEFAWDQFEPVRRTPSRPSAGDCVTNGPDVSAGGGMLLPPAWRFGFCNVTLNLLTTLISNRDRAKIQAQENVLRSLRRLSKFGVRSWIFTSDVHWAKKARNFGLEVVFRFRTNNAGTPCVGFMYDYVRVHGGCVVTGEVVFDGYFNGDVLLEPGLVETLRAVRARWGPLLASGEKGVLVTGIRYNKVLGFPPLVILRAFCSTFLVTMGVCRSCMLGLCFGLAETLNDSGKAQKPSGRTRKTTLFSAVGRRTGLCFRRLSSGGVPGAINFCLSGLFLFLC